MSLLGCSGVLVMTLEFSGRLLDGFSVTKVTLAILCPLFRLGFGSTYAIRSAN